MIGQPNAIGRAIERVPTAVQRACVDQKDHRLAMPTADLGGCVRICGQVHMLPALRLQTFAQNARDVGVGRAMKQLLWWFDRRQAQVDCDRMPLVGADAATVGAETEALLVVLGNDPFETGAVDGLAMTCQCGEQIVDQHIAFRVEL